MNCKWLRDFLALSQYGNYSQTAAQQRVTQPALSRYIRALEEMLGVPLLDRITTPVTPTRYGGCSEPYARHVLNTLMEACHELSAMTPATDNTLVVVSLHALSVSILPDMINHLQRSEPQLSFTTNASIQGINNHFNALMNRQIDLLVTYDLPPAQPRLETAGGLKRSLWRYERLIPITSAQLTDVLDGPYAPIPRLYYNDCTFVRRIIESVGQHVRPRPRKVFENGLGEAIREVVLCHIRAA